MKKAYRLSEDIRCVKNVSPGDINSQNHTVADEEQDRRCKKGAYSAGVTQNFHTGRKSDLTVHHHNNS